MRLLIVAAVVLVASMSGLDASRHASAQTYYEPERGSAMRADIMDALRPVAEWSFGPPVQFVVEELRTDGKVAFAMLRAQRPGGARIVMETTPLVTRHGQRAEYMNGPTVQALLVKSGRMWGIVDHVISATEAWWTTGYFCPQFGTVVPESCH